MTDRRNLSSFSNERQYVIESRNDCALSRQFKFNGINDKVFEFILFSFCFSVYNNNNNINVIYTYTPVFFSLVYKIRRPFTFMSMGTYLNFVR